MSFSAQGVPTAARATFADCDRSAKLNGRHPFKIAWEFSVDTDVFKGSLTSMEKSDLVQYAATGEVIVPYAPGNPRINTLYVE